MEAKRAVQAIYHASEGIRDLSGLTRATSLGRMADHAKRASEKLYLLVQFETQQALDAFKSIAAVDRIDSVFVGHRDLAASL